MLVAVVALLQQATYTGILISGSKRKGKTGNSMNLSFLISGTCKLCFILRLGNLLCKRKQGSFEFVGLHNHLQLKVAYGIGVGLEKTHRRLSLIIIIYQISFYKVVFHRSVFIFQF